MKVRNLVSLLSATVNLKCKKLRRITLISVPYHHIIVPPANHANPCASQHLPRAILQQSAGAKADNWAFGGKRNGNGNAE